MNGTHTTAPGCTAGRADTAETHGMVVFGTGVDCYLSHRAMFLPPYNFQVLLRVEPDARGKRAIGADRRAGFTGLHSFAPEDFALTELNPRTIRPRTTFCGNLIRGRPHDGIPIAKDIRMTVRTVVHFAELDPNNRGDELLTHLCFGRAGGLYLAHRIARRPSFDQIVAVDLLPGTVTDMAGRPLPDTIARPGFDHAKPIILGRRQFTGNRLRTGEQVVAAFHATAAAGGGHGFLAELAVRRQIYLEVADLC